MKDVNHDQMGLWRAGNLPSRDAAIEAFHAGGGYALKAIGEHFWLHDVTVSRIARRVML